MKDPVIRTENLFKEFSLEAGFFAKNKKTVYAVNDVSLAVGRGTTYGLAGESGCGKTTTARLLVRMYRPSGGSVIFTGRGGKPQDVGRMGTRQLRLYRERVKYIFQDPARSLNPRMSIFDILTAALRYSSLWRGRAEAERLAAGILEEVGLSADDLSRRPSEFSGGQRQRISIARGLIMNPEMLICDEIVSALDVSIQGQIINLLQELRAERNLSLLFITHDLKVACYFCDTIGVMYRGMLVEEAPAASLYRDALHPYTRLLFEGAAGRRTDSSAEVRTVLEKETCCPFAGRCKYAAARCRAETPLLREVSGGARDSSGAPLNDGGAHRVRCFCV